MTQHWPSSQTHGSAEEQVTQLREVQRLVQEIAGNKGATPPEDRTLDEAALISSAYAEALPIVQRRFDALAAETAAWAAAGVEALLIVGERGQQPYAAAARLAQELDDAIARMGALLSTQRPLRP